MRSVTLLLVAWLVAGSQLPMNRGLVVAARAQVSHQGAPPQDPVAAAERQADSVAARKGRQSQEYAAALNDLARLQMASLTPLSAEPTLRTALDILERLRKPNDKRVRVNVAIIRLNLARILLMRGDIEGAKTESESASNTLVASLGRDHQVVAGGHQTLALAQYELGNKIEARRLFNEASRIQRKALGGQHQTTAETQVYVAMLLADDLKLTEADAELLAAIEVLARNPSNRFLAVAYLARGSIAHQQYRYDAAENLYRVALATQRKIGGENHPDTAETMKRLARLARIRGDRATAEALLRSAVQVTETAFGSDNLRTAASLVELANHLIEFGDSQRLVTDVPQLVRRIQTIVEAGNIPAAHPLRSQTLFLRANLAESQGDVDRAESLLRTALELKQRQSPRDEDSVAESMQSLGVLLLAKDKVPEAETILRGAHEIRIRTLPAQHVDLALSFMSIGMLEHAKGELASAETRFQEAVSALPPDPVIASRFELLANTLTALTLALSRPSEAEPFLREAKDRLTEIFGAEHRVNAEAARNLGVVLAERGELLDAERLLRHALQQFTSRLGVGHPDVLRTMFALSLVLQAKGDYEGSQALLTDSVRQFGTHDGSAFGAWLTLGLVASHETEEDWAGSAALLSSAAQSMEQTRGPGYFGLAAINYRLGVARYNNGDPQGSLAAFDKAEEVARRSLGGTSALVGSILAAKAQLAAEGGAKDKTRALSLATEATTRLDRSLGPGSPEAISTRLVLAKAHWAHGDLDAAQNVLSDLAQKEVQAYARWLTLSDEEGYRNLLGRFTPTDFYISFHMNGRPEQPAAARLAFWSILQRKGTLQDILAEHARLQNQSDQGALLFARWMQAERSARACGSPGAPSAFSGVSIDCSKEVPHLLVEASQAYDKLIAEVPALARATAPVEFDQLTARLREVGDFALVEIVEYASYWPDAVDSQPERYVAYILFPNGRIEWVDLGTKERITSLATELRTLQSDPASDLKKTRKAARDLDWEVMQPIRAKLGSQRRLFVAPDGPLGLIDFSSLVDESDRELLLSGYDIAGLTSGRDLLRLGARSPVPSQRPDHLFADPAFRANVAPASQQTAGQGVLGPAGLATTCEQAFLREEWLAVPLADHYYRRFIAALPQLQVRREQDATKSQLLAIKSPRSVWLLTHGFFCTPGRFPAPTFWQNAMDRSAVVLAGGASDRPEHRRNGYLTAREIAGLYWHDAELVVLGACDTASGEPEIGDGVRGLRRALAIAGVRSQVMTLWQVSGVETFDVLVAFAERVAKGEPRLSALRNAQRALLNSKAPRDRRLAHPYYWAGVYFGGDPRRMPTN